VLLVSAPRQQELLSKPTVVKAKLADMGLATQLIRSSSELSVNGLYKIVSSWKDAQISDLNSGMQALALVPKDIETQLQVPTVTGREQLLKERINSRAPD